MTFFEGLVWSVVLKLASLCCPLMWGPVSLRSVEAGGRKGKTNPEEDRHTRVNRWRGGLGNLLCTWVRDVVGATALQKAKVKQNPPVSRPNYFIWSCPKAKIFVSLRCSCVPRHRLPLARVPCYFRSGPFQSGDEQWSSRKER